MSDIKKLSVLVSGSGTNFQAIIDNIENGYIDNAKIVLVISSNKNAYALKRAKDHDIKAICIDKQTYPVESDRTRALIEALKEADTDLVVLAGYMSILEPEFINEFRNRIINIHPALLPKHCGPGMYGKYVHEEVLCTGDSESGATVHYVDEGVDTGPVIIQESIPVLPDDTAETLAARVLEVEHRILPEAVRMYCNDEI